MKEKIDKLDIIKAKKFYAENGTVKKVKDNPVNERKYLQI